MVDELQLLLHDDKHEICSFWKILKTKQKRVEPALNLSNGDLLCTGRRQGRIKKEKFVRSRTGLMHKKIDFKLLEPVPVAPSEEMFFHSSESERCNGDRENIVL